MTDKVIEYKSEPKVIKIGTNTLETTEKNGIICSWSATYHAPSFGGRHQFNPYRTDFTWKFDWTKLKKEGVESLSGHLIVKSTHALEFSPRKIDINWKEGREKVCVTVNRDFAPSNAFYELHLNPTYSKKVTHDEMFAASDKTDAILVVEGKKIYVNKAFLSFHSDFFTALFSSNFKEGQLAEIPIKDVSHEDFCMLLSTIYPKQVFPNDKTAEKLLELADRFLMPSVTHIVEYHLLEHSKLSNEKSMWLADAYGMPELLEKCIQSMDTVGKARTLKESEEYKKMSLETIEKLFCRLLELS